MTGSGCGCKVGRIIEDHTLEGLNDDLVREREDGESLRDLADYVNRRVLETALTRSNVDLSNEAFGALTPEDALGSVYEALQGDDVPTRLEARVLTLLRHEGVDVGALRDDWVTHPTVRSHFNECLGIDTARTHTVTVKEGRNTIEWARAKCEGVVEQTFERLDSAGLVTTGRADASVSVRVTCRECGESYRVAKLLDKRRCGCRPIED